MGGVHTGDLSVPASGSFVWVGSQPTSTETPQFDTDFMPSPLTASALSWEDRICTHIQSLLPLSGSHTASQGPHPDALIPFSAETGLALVVESKVEAVKHV